VINGLIIVWQQRQVFFAGLANTVALTLLCLLVSMPLGALGALFLIEAPVGLRKVGRELVDLMRCVPFLLLAYVVYYGLPEVGLRFDAWEAGLASLVIYNVAYLVEIFRSATLALPPENIDAARAYGFTRMLTYRRIVFPQIVVSSAPIIGNQVIVMIKDTALLMIITVPEISFAANFINTNYFTPFAPFAVAMALYWGLCLIVELGVRRLSRLQVQRHG
jgi:polar amino acid transport system permease protein